MSKILGWFFDAFFMLAAVALIASCVLFFLLRAVLLLALFGFGVIVLSMNIIDEKLEDRGMIKRAD